MSALEELARVPWLDELTQRVDAFMTTLRSLPEDAAVAAADAWLFVFRERNLLFASWPVAPDAMRPHVPSPLDLDLFDGRAWITVEALQTALVRFRRLPDNPLAFDGVEMNVRTYVRFRDEPGIHFLSLDCPGIVMTTLSRVLFKLPFHAASVTVTLNGDNYHAESVRTENGPAPAQFAISGRITGPPASVASGTRDDFLLNRSRLFAASDDGGIYRGVVGHRPRVVQPITGVVGINTLAPLTLRPTEPPLLHYCPGADALAWPIVKVS